MALGNKLNIIDSAEFACEEERISKKKAVGLFDNKLLDTFGAGTFAGLAAIHKYLFKDIYDFAGKIRTVNLAKGNFRFAPVIYLQAALDNTGKMPQSSFDEIIEKYVEMNIAPLSVRVTAEAHEFGSIVFSRKNLVRLSTGARWIKKIICSQWNAARLKILKLRYC